MWSRHNIHIEMRIILQRWRDELPHKGPDGDFADPSFSKLDMAQLSFPKLLLTSETFGSGICPEVFSWHVQR